MTCCYCTPTDHESRRAYPPDRQAAQAKRVSLHRRRRCAIHVVQLAYVEDRMIGNPWYMTAADVSVDRYNRSPYTATDLMGVHNVKKHQSEVILSSYILIFNVKKHQSEVNLLSYI